MKMTLAFCLLLTSQFAVTPAMAQVGCVTCISFDTCAGAGGNGWRTCRFGSGYCVNTGFCSSRPARFELENQPATLQRTTFQTSLADLAAPDICFAKASLAVNVAATNNPTTTLTADAGTLIQLAQISPTAAHVAFALGDSPWDASDLDRASVRLRSLTDVQVMALVSGQGIPANASLGSTEPIAVSAKLVDARTLGVRVLQGKTVDVILEYRRMEGEKFKLVGWR